MAAAGFQALIRVRARAAMPYLIAGLQIAAPAAFLGAMVGEFTGADRGMGVLSIQTMRSLDVEGTWALAVIATIVAIAGYLLVGAIGRLLSPGAPPLLLAAIRPPTRVAAPDGPSSSLADLPSDHAADPARSGRGRWTSSASTASSPSGRSTSSPIWSPARRRRRIAANSSARLASTLRVTIPGYLAGLALGAVLAALFELFPLASRVATPVAIALRSIPIVATTPLIVLAFGRGLAGMLVIVAVMNFFPTLVACAQGLRQTPGQVIDFFSVFATGRLRVLLLARVPAMVPAFFAAARMAVPSAVLAATVAEWLATGTGIGNLMALTASTSNYNMLWSAVVVLTLVSVAFYLPRRRSPSAGLSLRFAPEQVNR